MFKYTSGIYVLMLRVERVADAVVDFLSHESKLIWSSVATLLLNYSIQYSLTGEEGSRIQLLSVIPDRFDVEEDEATFLKLLTTSCNLCYKNESIGELAGQLEMKEKLENVEKFKSSSKYALMSEFKADLFLLIK